MIRKIRLRSVGEDNMKVTILKQVNDDSMEIGVENGI